MQVPLLNPFTARKEQKSQNYPVFLSERKNMNETYYLATHVTIHDERKLSVKKYPLACRCMPTSSMEEKNIPIMILIRNTK